MGKPKRMDQIINILKTYQQTDSIKGTARRCGVSKNTVRGYLKLTAVHNADLAVVLKLPTEQLRQVLYPDKARPLVDRKTVFDAKVDDWIKELTRVGVNKQLLYEEYKRDHPDGYGKSQFYLHLARTIDRRDLTLPLSHEPGEKLQLDFAGKTIGWVDAESGEVRQCQVLIGVLPHSQHTFAIALPSQSTADFVHGINETLRFFGGLPKVLLSDNLKAFVIKADRYDPDFNDVMTQLAEHYQLDLQATRPRKPLRFVGEGSHK